MSSERDPNVLADALSLAMDDIRGLVHEALGTRTYRVYVVTRDWSGGTVGEGTPSEAALELTPRPLVSRVSRDRLGPGGREHAGDVILTEVSLRYTADELQPAPGLAREVGYKIVDMGGQGQPDQWYVIDGDPLSRRGDRRSDNADWRIHLRQTSEMTNVDGVDS